MAETITFTCSAPGKLILAGEHSVVHFTRALATVIDKRTFVQVDYVPAAADKKDEEVTVELEIDTNQMKLNHTWNYAQLLKHYQSIPQPIPTTLTQLLPVLDSHVKPSLAQLPHGDQVAISVFLMYYLTILRPSAATRGNLKIRIESQLPMSAGLGSSASFTAALGSGFVWLSNLLHKKASQTKEGDYIGETCSCSTEHTPYTIPRVVSPSSSSLSSSSSDPPTFQPCTHLKKCMNSWSYEGERILHGNPSGVDNSCAIYGGIIVYRKGEELKFLNEVPRLTILVVNTHVPRDTKKLVAGVGVLKQRYPKVMQHIFDSVEELVSEWLSLLKQSSESSYSLSSADLESRIGELMKINQGLLDGMGVGHQIIHQVLALGASVGFTGKLTGAGGGGCIILLKPSQATTEEMHKFNQGLEALKCECLETIVGQAGVWIREQTLKELPEFKIAAATQ